MLRIGQAKQNFNEINVDEDRIRENFAAEVAIVEGEQDLLQQLHNVALKESETRDYTRDMVDHLASDENLYMDDRLCGTNALDAHIYMKSMVVEQLLDEPDSATRNAENEEAHKQVQLNRHILFTDE